MTNKKIPRDAYKIYLAITGIEWFLDSLFITVYFVYLATQVTNDPFQLTLIEVVFTVTLFLCEIPTGILADLFSRRLSVIIGFALIGIAALFMGAVQSLGAILISQVIWALGFTFISGAKDAWITDEIGAEKAGKAYLRSSQISQVGLLVGIPIATALGTIALNLPILIAGVCYLLLASVLSWAMPEEGFQRRERGRRESWQDMVQTFREGLLLVRSRSVLVAIMLMSAIFGISSIGFDNLWTVHVLENLTFPDIGSFEPVVWFGGINIVVSVLSLAGTEIVRRRVDISQQRAIVRTLTFMSSTTAICMIVFGMTGSFWLAVITYCLSLTLRTTSMPLIITWINQNVDSNVRATVLSMEEQVFSLGQSIGGPMVGALGSIVSLPAALVTTGIARLPVAIIFLRLLIQGKREIESTPE
jgi:DHA3 family tetracycline resistance protein-like MFS transporter